MPRTKTTETAIEGFAEDLGRLLGTAQRKAESWLGQRKKIVKHLTEVRDTATQLLTDLGHQARGTVRRGRLANVLAPVETVVRRGPGRPKGPGRKRRRMSAEARARISAAQKARWAKQRASEKEKRK